MFDPAVENGSLTHDSGYIVRRNVVEQRSLYGRPFLRRGLYVLQQQAGLHRD